MCVAPVRGSGFRKNYNAFSAGVGNARERATSRSCVFQDENERLTTRHMGFRDEWRRETEDYDWGPPIERDAPSRVVARLAQVAIVLRVLGLTAAVSIRSAGDPDAFAVARKVDLTLFLAAVILFLVWVHRTNRNVRALGARRLKFSAWAAVAGFLAPIAWFFLPYLAVGELWRASEPHARGDEWRSERVPPWFHVWWITLLAHMTAWYLGLSSSAVAPTPAPLIAVPLAWISGALALLLVHGVEERLSSRRRLRSWAR